MRKGDLVMNTFRLGHVYDVTDFYHKNNGNDFERYYICADVFDFHIYRIVLGYNSKYEEEEDTKLIEQTDIDKRDVIEYMKNERIAFIGSKDWKNFPSKCNIIGVRDNCFKEIVKAVINCDTYDNDDVLEFRYNTPIKELIDTIDSGYGITILDKNLDVKENISIIKI